MYMYATITAITAARPATLLSEEWDDGSIGVAVFNLL